MRPKLNSQMTIGKAVEDSKAKAKILAESAGVALGEIERIDYSWGELQVVSRPLEFMEELCSPAAGGSYDIDIEADDIDVGDTVTIEWELK